MKLYEDSDDCPPVEAIIFSKVVTDFGSFIGISELNFAELMALRSACKTQLAKIKDIEAGIKGE